VIDLCHEDKNPGGRPSAFSQDRKAYRKATEGIVSRYFSSLDALEEAQIQRCQILFQRREIIHGTTCFHWWPANPQITCDSKDLILPQIIAEKLPHGFFVFTHYPGDNPTIILVNKQFQSSLPPG
jgi:hypothetical protein